MPQYDGPVGSFRRTHLVWGLALLCGVAALWLVLSGEQDEARRAGRTGRPGKTPPAAVPGGLTAGYESGSDDLSAALTRHIRVVVEASPDLAARLKKLNEEGPFIRGRVTFEDGMPVRRANIDARHSQQRGHFISHTTLSEGDGSFWLAVQEGKVYEVDARLEGSAWHSEAQTARLGDRIDFIVPDKLRLTLDLTGPEPGKPVALREARVRWVFDRQNRGGPSLLQGKLFNIIVLPDGDQIDSGTPVEVELVPQGLARAIVTIQQHELGAELRRKVKLRLRLDGGWDLRLEVLHENGAPFEGRAGVTVLPRPVYATRTHAEFSKGECILRGLDRNIREIRFHFPAQQTRRVERKQPPAHGELVEASFTLP